MDKRECFAEHGAMGHESDFVYPGNQSVLGRFDIFDGPILAFVTQETERLFEQALSVHREDTSRNCLSLLIPPIEPPRLGVRNDGEIKTFVASGEWVRVLRLETIPSHKRSFRALSIALDDNNFDVAIHVFSGGERPTPASSTISTEAIVPHKGKLAHLKKSLTGLTTQTSHCRITLCLDQAMDKETEEFILNQYQIDTWIVERPSHGPYVIRQYFASKTDCDFVAFQDSDDFSLPDRLKVLTDHALRSGADIVGCHELRIDEIEQTIFAIRFPLDVNAALSETASHPQLFPTTVVKSSYFKSSGGLSTTRRFGSDTEYLLRSYFSAKIQNVDRFLYIRRKRRNSLTTTPETALGSPIRVELDRCWKSDFEAIKRNRLALEDSTISLQHSKQFTEFVPNKFNGRKNAILNDENSYSRP